MAKRMINREVLELPSFLKLSVNAKLLYFLLIIYADDVGMVNPYNLCMTHQLQKASLIELANNQLIIIFYEIIDDKGNKVKKVGDSFESITFISNNIPLENIEVSVIKDWYHHNNIRKDIFNIGKHTEILDLLTINTKYQYELICNPNEESCLDLIRSNSGDPISIKALCKKLLVESEKDILVLENKDFDTYLISKNNIYGEIQNLSLTSSEYDAIFNKFDKPNDLINTASILKANSPNKNISNDYAYILKIAKIEKWKLKNKSKIADKEKEAKNLDLAENERIYNKEIDEIMELNNCSREDAIKIHTEDIEISALQFYLNHKLTFGRSEEELLNLLEKYKEREEIKGLINEKDI